MIALMQGTEWGWSSPFVIILVCAGILLLLLFVRLEARCVHPLIDLQLLRITTFSAGNFVFFAFQFNKITVFVFVALYLQQQLSFSPIDAGLTVLAAIAPTLFTSILAGKTADWYGSRRPLVAGLCLNALALTAIALVTAYGGFVALLPPLVIWGATLPFLAVSARRALMNAVPAEKRGQASGINLTIQMLGGTVGMALCATLLLLSGQFQGLFLLTGGLTLIAGILSWFKVENPKTGNNA